MTRRLAGTSKGVTRERRTPRRMMISLFAASALVVGIVATSAGATTRKTTVTTPGETVTSATNFTVRAVTKHDRSVLLDFSLEPHPFGGGNGLIASGLVFVHGRLNACRAYVTVRIQRWKKLTRSWNWVKTALTGRKGKYKTDVSAHWDPINPGKYRAVAPRQVRHSGDDICLADKSLPVMAPLG